MMTDVILRLQNNLILLKISYLSLVDLMCNFTHTPLNCITVNFQAPFIDDRMPVFKNSFRYSVSTQSVLIQYIGDHI